MQETLENEVEQLDVVQESINTLDSNIVSRTSDLASLDNEVMQLRQDLEKQKAEHVALTTKRNEWQEVFYYFIFVVALLHHTVDLID